MLLLQNFEEARKSRLGDPQLFGEALKLLGGDALRVREVNIAASMEILGIEATAFPPG